MNTAVNERYYTCQKLRRTRKQCLFKPFIPTNIDQALSIVIMFSS